jgi:hypothetical protein
MAFTYFVTPIYAAAEYAPPNYPPMFYYPIKPMRFRFPLPVLYSAPAAMIL